MIAFEKQGLAAMNLDTKADYGTISKTLHWVVAITIISLLAAGFIMINLDKSPLKWQIYGIHKAMGITILAIAVIRIVWRITHVKPPLPVNYPKWQRIASAAVHGLLYLITIIMPLSGWIMSMAADHIPSWFGLFELRLPIAASKPLAKIASNCHEIIAWILIACLILHIGAAIKDKRVLSRMLVKK